MVCRVQPASNVAINPPVGTEYIPYVNIGMDFNIDLSIFTYDLAQQIARVVLWNVPASSNLDATIYTEEGATPQSQTVRITAKFYDGDQARVNALQASVQNLVCPPELSASLLCLRMTDSCMSALHFPQCMYQLCNVAQISAQCRSLLQDPDHVS